MKKFITTNTELNRYAELCMSLESWLENRRDNTYSDAESNILNTEEYLKNVYKNMEGQTVKARIEILEQAISNLH